MTGSERIKQRFRCSVCGETSMVPVAPEHRDQTINYGCGGECDRATEHRPAGRTDWFGTTL